MPVAETFNKLQTLAFNRKCVKDKKERLETDLRDRVVMKYLKK